MQEYPGLYNLIEHETSAKEFYASLPDRIRDQICQQADTIDSETSLKNMAQQFLEQEG